MLATFLLSLREGLEAALIIGIVLGAVNKIRRKDLVPSIWFGTLSAVAISVLSAILLTSFGLSLEEGTEQIFEGLTMFIAAGILTWMIFWMSKQARFFKTELEEGIHKAASSTGQRAVFWLAFMAVVREGVELALFVTAAFFAGNQGEAPTNLIQTLAGTILGIGTAALLGYTIFSTTLRLDLHRFFQVTGFFLILFAAGLVAHSIHEFIEINWIPAIIEHVYDMNKFISESSIVGQLLQVLFGYNSSPSLTEMIAYFGYIATVGFFWNREHTVSIKSTAEAKV